MQSEIASLREQLVREHEALLQGMSGYAAGGAKHAFIRAKTTRLQDLQQALVPLIGQEAAAQTQGEIYMQVAERYLS